MRRHRTLSLAFALCAGLLAPVPGRAQAPAVPPSMDSLVAHEIAARVRHLGEDVAAAARFMIETELAPHRIGAGLIAMDAQGQLTAPFNTDGMFRGWIGTDGALFVATHR